MLFQKNGLLKSKECRNNSSSVHYFEVILFFTLHVVSKERFLMTTRYLKRDVILGFRNFHFI